jgi:hypothetical protein
VALLRRECKEITASETLFSEIFTLRKYTNLSADSFSSVLVVSSNDHHTNSSFPAIIYRFAHFLSWRILHNNIFTNKNCMIRAEMDAKKAHNSRMLTHIKSSICDIQKKLS